MKKKITNDIVLGLNALADWEKWTVSHESWAEPLYSKCCYGPAYVLSPRAVIGIVKAYEKTLVHFSKFEDIYITGKHYQTISEQLERQLAIR